MSRQDVFRVRTALLIDISEDLKKEPNKKYWKYITHKGNEVEALRSKFIKNNIEFDVVDFVMNPNDED